MSYPLPEGEDLRKATRWISENLKEDPGRPISPLIQEAIFKFDLSPKDGDFLINFYQPGER